ncbi:phage holin family protein [Streptomyces boninensis]|uniref:phage holin family protein n=1 Tax=Streptomyces boninensis TaxID=2039455 RepID=UPI003B220652
MSAGVDQHTERTLGQLVATATADMSALVHDEIALAKAELRNDVKKAGVGSGSFIVAAALALFGIPVLSFAAAYGLHALGLALGWSFLIVFGVHFVLAAIIGAFGYAWMKRINKPEKTIASARQTVEVFSGVRPGGRTTQSGRKPTDGVARSTS